MNISCTCIQGVSFLIRQTLTNALLLTKHVLSHVFLGRCIDFRWLFPLDLCRTLKNLQKSPLFGVIFIFFRHRVICVFSNACLWLEMRKVVTIDHIESKKKLLNPHAGSPIMLKLLIFSVLFIFTFYTKPLMT